MVGAHQRALWKFDGPQVSALQGSSSQHSFGKHGAATSIFLMNVVGFHHKTWWELTNIHTKYLLGLQSWLNRGAHHKICFVSTGQLRLFLPMTVVGFHHKTSEELTMVHSEPVMGHRSMRIACGALFHKISTCCELAVGAGVFLMGIGQAARKDFKAARGGASLKP